MTDFIVYLIVCAGVTYLIRLIPLLLFKEKIKNPFIVSMLHYLPNTILSVMSVPAIFYATSSIAASVFGLCVALFLAYKGKGLLMVALGTSASVLVFQLIENLF